MPDKDGLEREIRNALVEFVFCGNFEYSDYSEAVERILELITATLAELEEDCVRLTERAVAAERRWERLEREARLA